MPTYLLLRPVTIALGLLACAVTLLPPAPRAQSEVRYDVVVAKNVMVTMRDGIKLATDIYRPAKNGVPVEGKFPVIMERTAYNKDGIQNWARYFVPRGYIAIGQDERGRYNSEGKWIHLRADVNDGHDTAKWIGEQPWSDGGIGTVGTSYSGGTQHALALSNPPYLKTMVPAYSTSNSGRYGIRHNGAFELQWLNWIFTIGNATSTTPRAPGATTNANTALQLSRAVPDPAARAAVEELGAHVRDYVKGLPLRPGTTALRFAPEYESWLMEVMSHGDYDEFWKTMGVAVVDNIEKYKDIPVYHQSGWYDSLDGNVVNLNFVELTKSKKSLQKLVVGPWNHGGHARSSAGEAEFGREAILDFDTARLRWFDKWLKGIDNGVDREPKVRIFVMGGGDAHKTPEGRIFVGGYWRNENEWPLARTTPTPYYLHAGGRLSPDRPSASQPTRYIFDPRHPVPTLGGNVSNQGELMYPGGAMDQRCREDFWLCEDTRPLSARNDVLVFQTAPLERDVEVTGRLVVKLFAASNAVDTDFTAKLIDVYPPNADFPAGVDLNIGDSIVRARYRDTLEKATFMKPGEPYQFTIEMYPTSLVFKRGHRIRLDISSSNFPHFDINPNTGEPLNNNRRWAIAENAVYHDSEHPSHIVLPIIPAGTTGETGR